MIKKPNFAVKLALLSSHSYNFLRFYNMKSFVSRWYLKMCAALSMESLVLFYVSFVKPYKEPKNTYRFAYFSQRKTSSWRNIKKKLIHCNIYIIILFQPIISQKIKLLISNQLTHRTLIKSKPSMNRFITAGETYFLARHSPLNTRIIFLNTDF